MRIYLTFTFVLVAWYSFGQVDNEVIRQQAEQTATALWTDDYETLVKFTYPKVIEMLGGAETMIGLVKLGKVDMYKQGVTFEKVTIGEPQATVKAGEEIHCMVPQTIIMKVRNGKLKVESYVLAISKDKASIGFSSTRPIRL